MKNTKQWLWIALGLVGAGMLLFAIAMTLINWDFTKLSTTQYQTKEYILEEGFTHIAIETDTADLTFLPSADGKTRVVCRDQEALFHQVCVQDDTLRVKLQDQRKWYQHIGIGIGSTGITVYLPEKDYGACSVKADTSDIKLPENFKCASLEVQLSTGDIAMSRITCQEDISVKISTGDVKMTDVTCRNFTSTGSTGDLTLKNVIATQKLDLRRSTGDVDFDRCDGGEILIKTDTGHIRGSLLSQKVFITQTDTGKIRVPKSTAGGLCELTTDTGDITVDCPLSDS